MATKISALPAVTVPAGTDVIPVVQGGVTKKETITQITSIETTARTNADTTLTNNLATEVTNRTNADTTLQTDINTRIKSDGSVTFTGNQPLGGHKFTGLSAGTTTGDSVRYEQTILVSGANAFGANQDMGGFKLTGLGSPATSTDAASRGYVLGLKITDLTAPTSTVVFNSQQLGGILDPSHAQDAVTLNYLSNQHLWNLDTTLGSLIVDTNNTLVGGTSRGIQDCGTTFGTITGARTLNITTTTNKSNNFQLYIDPVLVSAGASLNILSGQYIIGAGSRSYTKVEIADGNILSIHPVYTPSDDSGVPDLYRRWISVQYDFATNGGGIGTISLDKVLPDNCIVLSTEAIIENRGVFTSSGSATIAWGYAGVTNAFDTATGYGSTPYTVLNAIKICSSGTPIKLPTGKTVTITIAGAVITGGTATIHIPILLNNI